MPRLRRILLNTATALSAVLFLAAGLLWARTFATPEIFTVARVYDRPINVGTGDQRTIYETSAIFSHGWLSLNRFWYHAGGGKPVGLYFTHGPTFPLESRPWQASNFAVRYSHDQYETFGRRELALPLWLVTALLAALPSAMIAKSISRRRSHATGRCPQCGYDLRATPTRCPECGTIPDLGNQS